MALQIGNLGSVYRDQEEYDQALIYYLQAIEILQEKGYKIGIADQHSNVAYAYSKLRNTTSAIENFQQAEELYEKLGETERAEHCRQNIKALQS